MNSARVAGGTAPLPAHSTLPEPQSAVRQENFPVDGSVEQSVRPQIRPDHELGTERVMDLPLLRMKPVGLSGVLLAPVSIPGHMVCRHLFTILNFVDCTTKKIRND